MPRSRRRAPLWRSTPAGLREGQGQGRVGAAMGIGWVPVVCPLAHPTKAARTLRALMLPSPPRLHSCLPLLLPAVEAGLGHEAWRIRQASVELCGELLFKVGAGGHMQPQLKRPCWRQYRAVARSCTCLATCLPQPSHLWPHKRCVHPRLPGPAGRSSWMVAAMMRVQRARRTARLSCRPSDASAAMRWAPQRSAASASQDEPASPACDPDCRSRIPSKPSTEWWAPCTTPLLQVLSKLYVTRSDVQYAVRNGALHNWKTLVVRTGVVSK